MFLITESINIVEYILAIQENTLTQDIIEKARDNIKTINNAMYVFGFILDIENIKFRNNELTSDDISTELENIRNQYIDLGIDTFIKFDSIYSILSLYLLKCAAKEISYKVKADFIASAIQEIESCENKEVKDNIYVICLNYIVKHSLILINKDLTKKILGYCKTMNQNKLYSYILPNALVNL